jgi:hypothetical protein
MPGIHAFLALKTDLDGREIRREDGASRFCPAMTESAGLAMAEVSGGTVFHSFELFSPGYQTDSLP